MHNFCVQNVEKARTTTVEVVSVTHIYLCIIYHWVQNGYFTHRIGSIYTTIIPQPLSHINTYTLSFIRSMHMINNKGYGFCKLINSYIYKLVKSTSVIFLVKELIRVKK